MARNAVPAKKSAGLPPLLVGAVAAIIVFIAILVAYTLNNPDADTPGVVLPSPVTGGAISVNTEDYEKNRRRIEVTPETVQSAISSLTKAGDYSRAIYVERFSGVRSGSCVINVWIHGQNSRIGINNGAVTKDILIAGDEIWIRYSDSQDLYYGHINEKTNNETDEYQSLISYEDISALDPAGIIDAGYTDHNGDNCIFAEYISGHLGYRNIVYISVDTGLIMGNEMYDGDYLIYKMTSGIPDISTPGDEFFIPPQR